MKANLLDRPGQVRAAGCLTGWGAVVIGWERLFDQR